MKKSRYNIEQLIIAYFEQNLTDEEKKYLLQLINQKNEYKELFEIYQQTYAIPDNISYQQKEKLKKNSEQYIINEWEDLCIRYFEDSLSLQEKQYVLETIKNDSEKQKIFLLYEKTKLYDNAPTLYNNKESLKKDPSFANYFEELCIQYIEEQISEQEKITLEKLIANDKVRANILFQFKQTKLKPNINVHYPNKKQLKKKKVISMPFIYWSAGIAATLLLFIMIYNSPTIQKKPLFTLSKSVRSIPIKPIYELPKKFSNTIIQRQQLLYANANDELSLKTDTLMIETNKNFIVEQKEDTAQNLMVDNYVFNKVDSIVEKEILKESLDKIFTNNRYNYFHEMVQLTSLQQVEAYKTENKLSWWTVLQKGSEYLSNAGANIKIQEYEQINARKKEIAIGNFYFSRVSKK
ncbi:MAG: hypothetical protein N2449_01880 [Bacteroidales bacterium]|nr:hypothetical protein [Bacteroidales bacterium]